MELLKQQTPLEFKHKDAIFLVKPRASAGDRLDLTLSGIHDGNGRIKFSRAEFARSLVRRFVVGWRGVTSENKEVPYSFEALDELYPRDPDEDVLLLLSDFILNSTDIVKKESEIKKDLRRQLSGV